jgi:peptide chain release factor 1
VNGEVFDIIIIDERPGQIILEISGKNVEDIFGDESGGHRVQRCPPNEKRGRIHTSTITVAVLPPVKNSNLSLNSKDIEWSTCRGSGAGGQHRNKTESAVIAKHTPSGISVRVESERSQHANKMSALHLLQSKIAEMERSKLYEDRSSDRKKQVGSGMRGDKRRTIRVQDGTVVDHITCKTWRYKDYVRGDW